MEPPRALVPASQSDPLRSRRVILQSERALVVFDAERRHLSVSSQSLPFNDCCVTCGRPLQTIDPSSNSNSQAPGVGVGGYPTFMDSNYFRLLSSSLPLQSPQIDGDSNSRGPNLPAGVFNQGYYEKFFREIRQLGRGYRGSVYLCRHVLDQIVLGDYAVKKIPIGDNKEWMLRMLREVYTLEQMRHFNVVEYRHCWIEDASVSKFGPPVPNLFLLMELANGGNLDEYVIARRDLHSQQQEHDRQSASNMRRRRPLSWSQNSSTQSSSIHSRLTIPEVWSFFVDICNGIEHLHSHGIMHRDLKPSNLLLRYSSGNRDSNEIPRILISDFGESENLMRTEKLASRTGCTGTLEFMAPELLKVDTHGKYYVEFSPPSDIWSMGMVLFFMCFSRLPYSQVDDIDILRTEILNLRQDSLNSLESEVEENLFPLEIVQLIKLMLAQNPRDRPTARDIVKIIAPMSKSFSSYSTRKIPRTRFIDAPESAAAIDEEVDVNFSRFETAEEESVTVTVDHSPAVVVNENVALRGIVASRFICISLKAIVLLSSANTSKYRLILAPLVAMDLVINSISMHATLLVLFIIITLAQHF